MKKYYKNIRLIATVIKMAIIAINFPMSVFADQDSGQTRVFCLTSCDRRTDEQTHDDVIYCASMASRGKNVAR